MKTVCSTEMPYVREAFETLGEAVLRKGRSISAEDVKDADMLAVRSTTRVARALLDGSRVRFVGTATIGFDHFDTDYFERAGIRWCYAPGCNANSVSEYVTASLLRLARRHGFGLEGRSIGVIGVGNVGSLVVRKAMALGMRVLPNDPPRERAGEAVLRDGTAGKDLAFASLDRLLAEADVVTLHVPLTREGPDATAGMADDRFFGRMRAGCVFLNSARGAVVRTDALLGAMARRTVAHAAIDTWEGEPGIRRDLLERSDIGTPHIAGYSFEGKVMGTVMVYREACRFLGHEPEWTPDRLLPAPLVPTVEVDANGRDDEDVLDDIVKRVYDVEQDDARLRDFKEGEKGAAARFAEHFDGLRNDYPVRREFRFTRVVLKNAGERLAAKVSGLGFAVAAG